MRQRHHRLSRGPLRTCKHSFVEVLVIGSGVAGSTMTAEPADADFDVLTLEAGPNIRLKELLSWQIWARRLKWAGPPFVGQGDFTGAYNFGMGWGTGGAGLHWYANWYRIYLLQNL